MRTALVSADKQPITGKPGVVQQRSLYSMLLQRRSTVIAAFTIVCIIVSGVLEFGFHSKVSIAQIPLIVSLTLGGVPLLYELLQKLLHREFGSDLLGGISIISSVPMHQYLAGAIIVLMLAGGEALESYALRSASSVLEVLSKRVPSIAHRKQSDGIHDVAIVDVAVGDTLVIYPHDICPVDGVVIEGHGVMDESYLTGEPFQITKITGSTVISGAINDESALTIQAAKASADSRYAKIMEVMHDSESSRPKLRRLGDSLGAIFTPVVLVIAFAAWAITGDAVRFLAVLVIATPCPLLIAIPITIIGSISLCDRRAIIVKNPVVLEQIVECRTAIFDKTGTLTYGEPKLIYQSIIPGYDENEVLSLAASLERYSKHPLARAILNAATEKGIALHDTSEVNEPPGQGLQGTISNKHIQISSRKQFISQDVAGLNLLPSYTGGMECIVAIENHIAAVLQFRDAPRDDSHSFITHLGPKHQFNHVMIVSGDRESEVKYLADQVGITEIYAQQSPEQKLAIVREETRKTKTLYVGDGINDAPAMMAATIGMAIGQNSDVTSEAAGVVVMDNSLRKVDEFMHVGKRMRSIALQSAIGGMVLSVIGMVFAVTGYLTPVEGAISQEVIDFLAVMNALHAAFPPRVINDY